MCMNCGCGMYDDQMGSPDTITKESFAKAAKAMGQTSEEAMAETKKAIEALMGKETK